MNSFSSGISSRNISLTLVAVICAFFIHQETWIGSTGSDWKKIITSDARGYYAYLPAVFIYQDLNFDFVKDNETKLYGSGKYLTYETGKRGNKYFPGTAIVLIPFFLAACLISYLAGLPVDGYNQFFFGTVSAGALFYLLLGLFYMHKTFRYYHISSLWKNVLILLVVFGTNLFHYVVTEPGFSHVYSFSLFSISIFLIHRLCREFRTTDLLMCTIIYGLLILIRPVNAIMIFSIPFIAGSQEQLKHFFRQFFKNKRRLFIAAFLFGLILFIYPVLTFFTHGEFFKWPYEGEGFDFLNPHLYKSLFSFEKGLFMYSPVLFVMILTGIAYVRKRTYPVIAFLLFFVLVTYMISSWSLWTYGGSFGMRPFIDYYPAIFLFAVRGLEVIRKKRVEILLFIGLGFLLMVNIIMLYQYETGIMHYSEMNKEKYFRIFLSTDKRLRLEAFNYITDELNESRIQSREVLFNDFDGTTDWGGMNLLTTEKFSSAPKSVKVVRPDVYSPGIGRLYTDVSNDTNAYIKVSLKALVTDERCRAMIIVSFESGDYFYYYRDTPIYLMYSKLNEWENFETGYNFPRPRAPHDLIKIYVWNDSDYPVYLDDFRVEFIKFNP